MDRSFGRVINERRSAWPTRAALVMLHETNESLSAFHFATGGGQDHRFFVHLEENQVSHSLAWSFRQIMDQKLRVNVPQVVFTKEDEVIET